MDPLFVPFFARQAAKGCLSAEGKHGSFQAFKQMANAFAGEDSLVVSGPLEAFVQGN